MESTTGTIKRITANGYGFIAAPDGVEYFFPPVRVHEHRHSTRCAKATT